MTIALDATYSLGDDLSGVGVYCREILSGLAAARPDAQFRFCYRPHRYLRSWRAALPANARRRLLLEGRPPRADLFHGLNQRLPRRPPAPSVVTFHDLFVLTGDYATPEFRARFTAQARHAARYAAAIIAVSAFTGGQVRELLGVEAARIHVVRHGVRILAPRSGPREKLVLHVGALQRRKNITRLVEAFESLDREWSLALAGGLGYGAESILARIASSPARNRIAVLGYVPEAQLGQLFARATIFAFPSLDEGFGMPVLEAMAAGLPVLTSSRSALPEVAGEAALYVDPEDDDAISSSLRRLAEDSQLREELIARGLRRAAEFTWEKAVDTTWKVYSGIL